jgi:hypothetical protein
MDRQIISPRTGLAKIKKAANELAAFIARSG